MFRRLVLPRPAGHPPLAGVGYNVGCTTLFLSNPIRMLKSGHKRWTVPACTYGLRASQKSGNHGKATRIIALTGFMGAGKSTVGRALAKLLGWAFLDLDEEIETRQRQRIQEVFRTFGENRFREIEAIALRDMLERLNGDTVIALGGGTFIQPTNAEQLHAFGAHVIFLETPIALLRERCLTTVSLGENVRPLAGDPGAFSELYARRLPQYRKANLVVGTEGKTAELVAQEIAKSIRLAAKTS